MHALALVHRPLLESAAVRAAAFVFFANGFMFANWVVRIPAVKSELGLGEAMLGVALLFLAIGGIVAMPLGGALVAKLSSRRVAIASGFAYGLAFTLLGLASDVVWLSAALFLLGLTNGAMDVSMNAQADAVERGTGIRCMSLCHAMFSLGLASGTVPAGAFAALGVDVALHLFLVGAPLSLIHLTLRRTMVADAATSGGPAPAFALPRGPLLLLGLICLCGAVVEGAMNDWIAVYVRETLGRDAIAAAVSFGAFSVAMLVGRLTGDLAIDALGSVRLVRFGLLAAAVGIALATVGTMPALIAGFALVGLGIANVFPSVFRAAGRVPGRPPGPSMAAAVTLGYGGFLLGPPLIGFVAEATSLKLGFAVMIPLCVLGAALAGTMRVADVDRG